MLHQIRERSNNNRNFWRCLEYKNYSEKNGWKIIFNRVPHKYQNFKTDSSADTSMISKLMYDIVWPFLQLLSASAILKSPRAVLTCKGQCIEQTQWKGKLYILPYGCVLQGQHSNWINLGKIATMPNMKVYCASTTQRLSELQLPKGQAKLERMESNGVTVMIHGQLSSM